MRQSVKATFLILLLGAIILVAFLGIGFMEHGISNACPFSIFSGNGCPPVGDILALTIHHISGLQHLMQFTITPDSILLLSILLLAVISLIFFVKVIPQVSRDQHSSRLNRSFIDELGFNPNQQLLYWLALLNKRDPHVSLRMYDVSLKHNFLLFWVKSMSENLIPAKNFATKAGFRTYSP